MGKARWRIKGTKGEAALALASKPTLEVVLSRLVAVDRISFYTIGNSVDIQEGLVARGLKAVKSHDTIRAHVSSYADQIRKKLVIEFHLKIANHEKFALTLDEYTSMNNRW